MSQKTYYVTTPIYYVNATPHIGTAYTSIVGDVLARFMRLDGYEVKFLTGTDEHGQKVEQAARKAGRDPQEYVDDFSQHFRKLSQTLNLTEDDFLRTSQDRHKKAAQALWQKVEANGHIYLSKYAGWYSVRDEAFFAESELIDGKSPSGAEVEWVEEPSYFFKLSAWQKPLLKFYEENPDFIAPESRRNEVIRFVEGGLRDLSISRSTLKWGIPVPGDESHVMYVWMDALTCYIAALGFPDIEGEQMKKFWPHVVHLVGKDILRFHAVYWPAFLMAAGIEPPKRLFAHGWWTMEGQKISKSLGNVIDPQEMVDLYGIDQLRYFMVREIPFGLDGDFSKEALVRRVNADLANDFGNLVQRVLSFIHKHAGAAVPQPGEFTPEDQALLERIKKIPDLMRKQAHVQAVHKMCEELWQGVSEANRYVDAQQPWSLRKTDPARMNTVLFVLAEVIRHLAILASPIIPLGAANVLDQLSIPQDKRTFVSLEASLLKPGNPLPEPVGVFPRIV